MIRLDYTLTNKTEAAEEVREHYIQGLTIPDGTVLYDIEAMRERCINALQGNMYRGKKA